MANKPETKTKTKTKERMVEKKRKREKNKPKTLYEKTEEARNVNEQCDKGWMHVIRVHDTTHLAVTTTLRGSRRSRNYPPHSYIVNERYNPRNKRASKVKKTTTVNCRNWSLAQPCHIYIVKQHMYYCNQYYCNHSEHPQL